MNLILWHTKQVKAAGILIIIAYDANFKYVAYYIHPEKNM